MKQLLRYDYNPSTDVINIEGNDYSGQLFREWGIEGIVTNTWFKLVRGNDGQILFVERKKSKKNALCL